MILRIMLVGFVTSMGLDLPGDRGPACPAETCRAWVDGRLAEASGLPAEDLCVLEAAPARCVPACEAAAPACDDAVTAFEAATKAMAAEFTAALADDSRPCPEVAAVAADLPGFVALPSGEEETCVAGMVAEAAPAAMVDGPDDAPADAGDEPALADRVSSAVRLTGEAIEAWAAVLR